MVVRNYVNADVITQYDVIGCNLHSCRNRLLEVYTRGDRRRNLRRQLLLTHCPIYSPV